MSFHAVGQCFQPFIDTASQKPDIIEKCCQLFLLQDKSGSLLSTKWIKRTPKISHFFGPGTWTKKCKKYLTLKNKAAQKHYG